WDGLIAARHASPRAERVHYARDGRGVAADAKLRAARDDLDAELPLGPVDVRLVITGDEHHLVGVGDEDRDLRRCGAHACAFSSPLTTLATSFPSARPFVSAMVFGITSLVSCGPFPPVSALTRRASSARAFCSASL